MRAKDILAQLADRDFLEAAGPAVLRLKLLEATYLAENRRLSGKMREAARQAAEELRRLILERPSVSLIDQAAKRQVDARPAEETPPVVLQLRRA